MSQAGILDIESANPQIPTSFTTDSGTAIPLVNNLEILGGDGITTSGSGKTITVTLDNPVNVSLGGTGLSSIPLGAMLVGSGSNPLLLTSALTNGQLLIGDTSTSIPVPATLTAGAGMTITNSPGAILLESSGSVAITYDADSGSAVAVGGIITFAGGTGLTSSAAASTVTFDLDTPVIVANGGTGATSLTDGGILLGSGTGAVTVLGQATHGQLPIGSTGADPVIATLTAGTGISITNAAGSITIDATGGGITWNSVTGATQALAVSNGYVGNRGTTITYTLPNTAAFGSEIIITNIGAGLPVIAQNAGESINFTGSTTTVGVGGSLTAINQFSSLHLICVVADTTWNVIASTGSWTIV